MATTVMVKAEEDAQETQKQRPAFPSVAHECGIKPNHHIA